MIEQPPQRTRWLKPLVIVGALVAAALFLRWTVFRPKPVAVSVYRVAKGRVEDTVVNSRAGTVQSRRRSQMSPGLAGVSGALARSSALAHRSIIARRVPTAPDASMTSEV